MKMNRRQRDTLRQMTLLAILIALAVSAICAVVLVINMVKKSQNAEVDGTGELVLSEVADSGLTAEEQELLDITKQLKDEGYIEIQDGHIVPTFDTADGGAEYFEPADEMAPVAEEAEGVIPDDFSPETSEREPDEYEVYQVSQTFLENYGGMVLARDGKFYSMDGAVSADTVEKYDVGYTANVEAARPYAYLYFRDRGQIKHTVPTELYDTGIVAAGDFPLLKLRNDEDVRLYSTSGTPWPTVAVYPASFYGDTIMAGLTANYYAPFPNRVIPVNDLEGGNPEVLEMDDTPVADVRRLTRGQSYKYVWFVGTAYNEMVMPANCRSYEVTGDMIQVPVTMGKNGYATVDLSSLSPGLYYTDRVRGDVFEIIE